jgi:hypothetical protein
MQDLEIPRSTERGWRYRLFEVLPGLASWALLAGFLAAALASPARMAPVVGALLLVWAAASVGATLSVIRGHRRLRRHTSLPWNDMLRTLDERPVGAVRPAELVHAVIVATWNESLAVLRPTVEALLASDYDLGQVVFVLAYEERGGPDVERRAHRLVAEYGRPFRHAMAVKHRDAPGEVVGKGANITAAGRRLARYLEAARVDPARVVVTTLDADNRVHPSYLAALSHAFCTVPDPVRASFQPIPLYLNNVWDVPVVVRLIATTSSLWNLVISVRPRLVRNASAHAQSLRSLLDMGFWSVRTVVEDGHQFWRSYFHHDGRYTVHPLSVPVYQDAVLATAYGRTLRAQFTQLRRWAWGASDIPYVAEKGYFTANDVPKWDLTLEFLRLVSGHVLGAVAPPVLAVAPLVAGLSLVGGRPGGWPLAVACIVAATGLVSFGVAVGLSARTLPPRRNRPDRLRWAVIALQWTVLPVTALVYGALPAINAQTRLLLGRRLETFDLTEKATRGERDALRLGSRPST